MKVDFIDLVIAEENKKEKQMQEYLYLDIPYTDCDYNNNNTSKKKEPKRVIIIDL